MKQICKEQLSFNGEYTNPSLQNNKNSHPFRIKDKTGQSLVVNHGQNRFQTLAKKIFITEVVFPHALQNYYFSSKPCYESGLVSLEAGQNGDPKTKEFAGRSKSRVNANNIF